MADGGWGCWGCWAGPGPGGAGPTDSAPCKVPTFFVALGVKLGDPIATPRADGSVLILLQGWACVRNWGSSWLLLCVGDVTCKAGAQEVRCEVHSV